ncbi:putative sulfate transporter [Caulifigura coniformis]|uniref:Putative sulfate transporter n=1 Tax=Caulifigura coniformis TaxID=2527983 RepID=A0A517S9X1_9PLAN|nr:SulP family inorganic anion transporter [Caulifigura coniformis]QDT52927.1 putative sulfate transporter [Caulifigura coniformis]
MPSSPRQRRTLAEHLFRLIPALDSARSYSWATLRADAAAGLTVSAVAVPQAMAYAQIAGIPAQYGLYTAIVMTAVGALLDSSKHLINGPTNAISIAVLSAIVAFPADEKVAAAVLLAFIVGVIQLGITLMRLGDLNRFISHAVIVGFTLGAAVLLVLDQIKNLLGLAARGTGEDHFLKRLFLTLKDVSETNLLTLSVGLGTVVLALGLRAINRRFRLQLPEFLGALASVGCAVWLFNLEQQGVAIVGRIPAALPGFQWPTLNWGWIRELSGSGLAIALLGLLEAVAMAKAIASQTGQKLDVNQQCLSEAVANTAGSFFQCYPGSGSLTRSVVNKEAGAQTQWSGVISAVAVALTILFLAPLAYYIPRAGLAGILMISAYRLVEWDQLGFYIGATRFDAIIVTATAVSAVAISIEFCVLIGIFLSFVLYVPRAARVHLTELTLASGQVIRERIASDAPCSRIRMFSLEGELFFGAAPELEQHLATIEEVRNDGVRVVILRMKRARNPDGVCLQALDRFIERMRAHSVTVILCALRPDMMEALKAGRVLERLGEEHVFVFQETGAIWTSTLEAVRFAYERIGVERCATCPRRAEADAMDWSYAI